MAKLSEGLNKIKKNKAMTSAASGSPTLSEKDKIRAKYGANRDMSKVTVIPAAPEPSLHGGNSRKRTVVYVRVSTDGIAQTSSFELQKNFYLKMVRQKPEWKLVGLYADEGITATSMEKRVGLLTMLEDARAGKFDIIVTKSLSRLSRNLMDCMNIIYELRKLPHPVGILFETENMFTLDRNVDFTLQVLSLVAQEESHKKSEAMNASVRQRFSQGQYLTPAPLGFDNDEDGKLIINEEEADTVRIIHMMYLAGMSVKSIIEVLEMLGRRTKTKKLKNGTIKQGSLTWNVSSVMNILKNERVCGDVLAQKTWTPDYLNAQRIADQFKEETGTVEEMKHLSRSVAIYYSEILSKHKDNITLEDLGLRRYDAACIRQMLISGLQPEEGWEYLDGMAHMSKSSFSLYPSEWADEFGENYYSSSARRFEKKLKKNRRSEESATTYGWTVGLDVPTMETVREAIAHLQEAKA